MIAVHSQPAHKNCHEIFDHGVIALWRIGFISGDKTADAVLQECKEERAERFSRINRAKQPLIDAGLNGLANGSHVGVAVNCEKFFSKFVIFECAVHHQAYECGISAIAIDKCLGKIAQEVFDIARVWRRSYVLIPLF